MDRRERTAQLDPVRLREKRKERGDWTQLKLAQKAGVSLSTVERAERGIPIEVDSAIALANAFKTTVAMLKSPQNIATDAAPVDQAIYAGPSDRPAVSHSDHSDPATTDCGNINSEVTLANDGRAKIRPALQATEDADVAIEQHTRTDVCIANETRAVRPGAAGHFRWDILALVVVIAAIGLGLLTLCLSSTPKLAITRIKVFDEAYREGPVGESTLSSLHQRGNRYFDIKSPDDFLLVFGFMITRFAIDQNGHPDLKITLEGLRSDMTAAWHTTTELSGLDDWKNMLVPRRVGAFSVLNEFEISESGGKKMPLIATLQCAQAKELADWTGSIQITVTDNLAHTSAKATTEFDLKKEISSSGSHVCL